MMMIHLTLLMMQKIATMIRQLPLIMKKTEMIPPMTMTIKKYAVPTFIFVQILEVPLIKVWDLEFILLYEVYTVYSVYKTQCSAIFIVVDLPTTLQSMEFLQFTCINKLQTHLMSFDLQNGCFG